MDDPTKARVRLYLRSERARGLSSVPAREKSDARPFLSAEESAQPQPPQKQAAQKAARPAPPSASPQPLFPGAAPEAKASGFAPIPLDQPFTAPILSTDEKRHRLSAMNDKEVRLCTRCRLCETRTHTVFGEGDIDAKIFFIGEGPGET